MDNTQITSIAKQLNSNSMADLLVEFIKLSSSTSDSTEVLDELLTLVNTKTIESLPKSKQSLLRIYKKTTSDSILTVNFDKMCVSTVSSYHDKFFDSLANGEYSYFPISTRGVEFVSLDIIVFSEQNCDGGDGFNHHTPKEKFLFIGEASNPEELSLLLK